MKNTAFSTLRSQGWSLALLLLLIAVQISSPSFIIKIRNSSYDWFQRLHPRVYQDAPVKILAIDDQSLEKIGQFPWPRTKIAELIDKLQRSGAKVIVFDMLFSEQDRTSPKELAKRFQQYPELSHQLDSLPDNDATLIAAMNKAAVVTGFMFKPDEYKSPLPTVKGHVFVQGNSPVLKCFSNSISSLPSIEAAGKGNGTFSYIADEDGVIRTVPLLMCLQDRLYPSISAEAVRLFKQQNQYTIQTTEADNNANIEQILIGDLPVNSNGEGYVWLNYTHSLPERYIPAWQLFEDQVKIDDIKDKIVFVGVTAGALMDMRFNPFGYLIPGVEVHAQLTEQLLQSSYLTKPYWEDALIIALLILIWSTFSILNNKVSGIALMLICFTGISFMTYGAWLLFIKAHLLIDPIFPSLSIISLFMAFFIQKQLKTENEKRWLRNAFGRYVSPNRVKHLIDNPDTLVLGGEYRECTFVMTDLAGFTTLMEKYPPHECVLMLNSYLEGMINIAFKYQGTLDRIVGDAVAVIFSAPIPQPDHCQLAIQCALEMDAYAMQFVSEKDNQGIKFGITRIGVCTGNVLIGNFGGKTMFDYRALGDPINTAARLESVNKQLGTRICVAESTLSQCNNIMARPIGSLILKGKQEKIKTYELLSEAQFNSALTSDYMTAYQKMDAEDPDALESFTALLERYPDDPLSHYHQQRLKQSETGSTITMSNK
ncbi:MAG: CHASE2 domain-containing protein [Gammaproteobacteria bacterium]